AKYTLAIQSTGWITRSARQDLGALDNANLLAALFSQDAIVNKRNTDAIEVAPNTLVAARVVAHEPEAQRKFDEVKDEIADALRQQEAFKRSEEHTSELQSLAYLVCRLLLEKKKKKKEKK